MNDADEPRPVRGQALNDLLREDLELFSVGDLQDRIAALEMEINRARLHMDKKKAGRAAADALFGGLK
jgi:uncharacterized small protein (DUF1192 family)